MKKILIQIIVGYFCSFISGVCFAFIYTGLSKLGIEIDYFGCKSQILLTLFIGLPIGSLAGFLLSQRLTEGVWRFKIILAVAGCVLSLICVIVSIPLLDIFGGWVLCAWPLFSTLGFLPIKM